MTGLYTVCAYGGIAVIACGYWYLSNKKPRRQPTRGTQQKEAKDRERERARALQKEKSKKIRSGGESSGNEAQRRNRTKKETKDVEPFFTATQDNIRDDDVDDREFARQLSNVKTGTTMAPKQEAGSQQKSVKLSKAIVSDDDDNVKKTNGEHGSDGDDDLSSVASPQLNATVLKAGDVSDMIENTTSGPSILRLTEPATQQPPKQKREIKQKEPELTKKQRQHKAKREAAKLEREEQEKVRRQLEEKQRRTAREAEGRAPKDGSSTFYTAVAPKTSPWTNTSSQNAPQPVQLLDTYSSDAPPASTSYDGGEENLRQGTRQPPPPAHLQYSDLPSEEEQIRILSENEGWNEVRSKKSKGKLAQASSEASGGGSTEINNGKFDRLGDFDTEA